MSSHMDEDPKLSGLKSILEMLLDKGADKYRPKPEAKGEMVVIKAKAKPEEEGDSAPSEGDALVDNLLRKKDGPEEELSESPEEEEKESWIEKVLKSGKMG